MSASVKSSVMRLTGLTREFICALRERQGESPFLFAIYITDLENTFNTSEAHHHYVPSVVNRSAVMDLHRSRSCGTLIQSLYDIFVHSLILSVHIVLGLPRPLLPFILPSISNRCTPFPLIMCPKY